MSPSQRPGGMTADQRRLLDRLLGERPPGDRPGIRRVTDQTRAELSSAQRRIWFFDRVRPGSALYVITGVARLTGVLDVGVLRRCLDEVVRRHEALRTTFHGDFDDEPWSRVNDPAPVPVEEVDLSALPEPERAAAVRERVRAEARRPFDLSRDLMVRAVLLRTAADEHLFHLSMHHIAADGWSLGVLLGELGVLYPAFLAGRPSPLPELPVQYADFAAWQRDRLREPAMAAMARGWVEHLRGAVPPDLPTDRPRAGADSFAGACVPVELPAELVAELTALANARGATPYMVLLAALAALLSRWSGSTDDVVLGAAVAGRDRFETEPLIGFFVNTLALRIDLGGDPTFGDLVDRARTVCLDAYARQEVPFEQVVAALQPERHPGARVPLVRHMLVLHNTPRPQLTLPGLHLRVLPQETGTAKFDLQLELAPTPAGELTGWIEYSSDLFDEQTVRLLADGWVRLLAKGVRSPDEGVDAPPLLSDEDSDLVVRRWSDGGDADGDDCLHLMVERVADRRPRAVAVLDGDDILTYGELEERANRLANRLIADGVARGDVVGVRLPRSAAAVVAMLGVLKAGAAYLPLEPDHPDRRLAGMVADATARVVVTAGDVAFGPVHGEEWRTLCLDDVTGDASATRPAVPVQPRDAAYVVFTSGSTGRPKGAVNEHAAVVNRIRWMQREYHLDPAEAVLHKTPLGFDVSGWEWLWPLSVGARVVVAGRNAHRDPARIARLIADHGVTTCHFVPSMLRAFLAEPAAARCAGVLSRLVCSGEELPPALAARAYEVLPGVAVHNLYGPTEAAIDVTAWPVPARVRPEHAVRLPIGRPIAGARIHVLDERMRPVPPGVPGELYIGGVAVGRGYAGRPGRTAERFVPDPFHSGQRLYRTGDRARWTNAGELDFLGRLDFQVKVRGQRIEPGEVAAALATHPDVERVVVESYRDAAGEVQLVAYTGLRQGAPHATPAGQVARWQEVFDDTYRGSDPVDPDLDLSGWVDSYTGDPIPEPEMREWVEEAVARIRALRPRALLEIGCGTGLLALRLAPGCTRYCGTDISTQALARLGARLSTQDREVELAHRAADDFSQWGPDTFDTVVLNSVAQYLPDADYLARVIRGALGVLRPGGHLFVGDVRSLPLLEAFHCSVLLRRLPSHTPLDTLRALIDQQVTREEELVVHPALFAAAAGPDAVVTTLAKSSPHRNELTRFRYDVVVRRGPVESETDDRWDPWPGTVTAASPGTGRSFGWTGVLDVRVARDLLAVRFVRQAAKGGEPATVGALRRLLDEAGTTASASATEPARLAVPGHEVLPYLGAEPGTLDIEVRPEGARPLRHRGTRRAGGDLSELANDPRGAANRRLMVAALREHATATLPAHMVPASFVVLRDWPVGANGKLDRAALPPPDGLRPLVGSDYVAPRTDTERAVAEVWQEVLGVDRVGVHDDFFALGGHSLLAVQLVSRLRALLGRELVLGNLLRRPTVAAVAEAVAASPRVETSPIGRVDRRGRTVPAETGGRARGAVS